MTTSILIDVDDLAARIGDPRLCLLDASVELPPPRFDGDHRVASGADGWRAAHLPGARHADLLQALADPDAAFSFARPDWPMLAAALQRLGVRDGAQVVVYDRSDGFWAARLWWMLRSLGITARVLDGGLRAWRAAGLPLAQGELPAPTTGPLGTRPQPALWADRQRIEAIVQGSAPGTLVCALSAALFAGHAPTRYARRGHIPGSLNLPARQVFEDDGRYLAPARLREVLAPLRAAAGRPLVLYCGGGISAAALALALTVAGESAIALYDGSLQEWAADPTLPLQRAPDPPLAHDAPG